MRSTLRSLFALMAVMGMMFGTLTLQASAQTANQCIAYGDGTGASGGTPKIDVNVDDVQSVTYTAPDGYLVDGYCVKAGSVNNDLGPQYHNVDPPVKTITIQYFDGVKLRDISHYSFKLVPETTTQGEWCSPGYWRQEHHFDSWEATDYTKSTTFGDIQGSTVVKNGKLTIDITNVTLWNVLQAPEVYGGNAFNLAGSLLSAAHPDVDFEMGDPTVENCPLN